MRSIEQVLNRRADLSTFLVHLTRADDERHTSALENLSSILDESRIRARTPYGAAKT